MAQVCASCGTPGDDRARFCAACGTPLAPSSPSRLERRPATALFADVVGSTSLGEHEDPEVVRALLGRAFARVERVIEQHGGLLEKYVGDAILAVFGVPAAHEDDPERAVRAALAIQAEIAGLDRELAAEGRAELRLRIGIEAGEVLVDADRVEGPRHGMLTGDSVNTAARLEQAAAPGEIVIGPAAHAATAGHFELAALATVDLRGKTAEIPVWRVLGARSPTRGMRAPLRLEARLVGRAAELGELGHALGEVRATGQPRLVTVCGPAGIGKSRLAHEFLQGLGDGPAEVAVRRGRCVAYGNVAYSALAEAMKAECEVLDDDPPTVLSVRAAATLERLLGSHELLPHLEALIGSGGVRRFGREDLFDAWRRILEGIARRRPLVLVLEDVHWGDDGLLDFVEHVARWARGPILVVALGRPELLERRPRWADDGALGAVVTLAPLEREQAVSLIGDLLGPGTPPDLPDALLEAVAGNPLYCEEIVRMLVDRGVVRLEGAGRAELAAALETVEVPRSIQGLLAARLDTLGSREKSLLQDAAVVGRTFWIGAVAELGGVSPHELGPLIDDLERKGFVARREPARLSGEREYAFHHVLVRDVAYDSLPKAARAAKHAATARWAELQAGARADEIAELLATHLVQALRWLDELGEVDGERRRIEGDAWRWTRAAGDRAGRLWQQREAVRWLRTALDLGERIGRSDVEQAEAWESYARASDGIAPVPDVVQAWEEALARYERAGRVRDSGRAEAWIAHAATWDEDATEARRRAERAVFRLDALGESTDLAFALYVLGRHHLERDELDRAEPLLRRAVAVAARVGDAGAQARANISLGWTLHARHRADETIPLFDEALEVARAAGDLALLLDALEAVLSAAVEVTGDYARAEALNREAIEVAQRAGNLQKLARAQLNLGYLLREVGRLDEAAEPLRLGRTAALAAGDQLDAAWTRAVEGLLDALRGDPAGAAAGSEDFSRLLAGVDISSVSYVEEVTGLLDGYALLGRGDPAGAADVLAAAQARVPPERLSVWFGQLLLFEGVAAAVRAGHPADARASRDRLAGLAADNVPPRAFLAWADGLLETDPDRARRHLEEAATRLETLGRRVDLGRCLLDLADARAGLSGEVDDIAARGRAILEACGAVRFPGRAVGAGLTSPTSTPRG